MNVRAEYQQFLDMVQKVAEDFKKLDKKGPLRLISHIDADGISACALMIHALDKENRSYVLSTV
ncbi:hypothetical protein COY95_03215, partial [Candidatus Woesearchaeota archaeon CG_4_10_14_0_8_um_filter_47_5]